MVTSHIRKSIGKVTSLEMPASSSWSTHITASEFKRLLSGLWCQASLHSVLWDRQLMAPQLIAVGTRTASILISKEGEAFWSHIVSKKHHGEVSATDSRLAVKRPHPPPHPPTSVDNLPSDAPDWRGNDVWEWNKPVDEFLLWTSLGSGSETLKIFKDCSPWNQ